jgi:hypothetical protein
VRPDLTKWLSRHLGKYVELIVVQEASAQTSPSIAQQGPSMHTADALLLRPGQTVSSDLLVELLWGDNSLVVDRSRIDAHRFETTVKHLAPLETLRWTEDLVAALDGVDDALAQWRGDAFEDVAGGVTPDELTRLDTIWGEGMQRWARLSTTSNVVTVQVTGHAIQDDEPTVVISELLKLLP